MRSIYALPVTHPKPSIRLAHHDAQAALCRLSVPLSAAAYAPNVDKPVDKSWEDYKAKYKKTYKMSNVRS